MFDFESDFGNEYGIQLVDFINGHLSKYDFRTYNRKVLAEKGLATEKVNGATIKKIKKELDVDYIVTGGISKKTDTLYIVSVFLKNGKTDNIKMTDYPKFKKLEELKSTAEIISEKIKRRTGELK